MGSSQDEVDEQIRNEGRVIAKVANGHENIIKVLNQGWFDDERYYLDMELCLLNLEDYMRGDFKSVVGISKYFDPRPSEDILDCFSLWGITNQIVRGLEFLHSLGELHRDLKPQNGKPRLHLTNQTFSSFVASNRHLEDHRFWTLFGRNNKKSVFNTKWKGNRMLSPPRVSQRPICR